MSLTTFPVAKHVPAVTTNNGLTGTNVQDQLDQLAGLAGGLITKTAVDLATVVTTGALPAGSYDNGTAGVGATFTVTATGTLTIDGVLTVLNQRILVQSQADATQNGVYIVTTAGAVGVQAVLTRATDADTGAELLDGLYWATSGSANAGKGFFLTNSVAPTIGIDNLTYQQYNPSSPGNSGIKADGTSIIKQGNTLARAALTGDVTAAQGSSATTVAGVAAATKVINENKGANVAAANNLVLGADGNTFHITGATQINLLASTNFQAGTKVDLIFDSNPLVKHNQTVSGANKPILLLNGADYQAAAGATLRLVYDGTSWYDTRIGLLAVLNGLYDALGAAAAVTRASIGANIYDMGFNFVGKPGNSQNAVFIATRAVTLPASLTGSEAKALTASTGTVSFDIQVNGSSKGSATFTASATGTFTFASQVVLAAGDIVKLVAPSSADSTLADIGITLSGTF